MATPGDVNEGELTSSGGPPFPGATEQVNVDTADGESCYKPTLFCAIEPPDLFDPVPAEDTCTDGPCPRAGAAVAMKYVWEGRGRLRVFFQNPDDPQKWGWKYNDEEITVEKIVEWANVWNPDRDPKVPVFVRTTEERKGDIRIELSDNQGCWSVIGMKATKVRKEKPTMVLNLGNQYREEDKRSLVIHEFGHALGLEHEHQRPDFWEGVKEHIDLKAMKNDDRVRDPIYKVGVASFGAGWFKEKKTFLETLRKVFGISRNPKMKMTTYDSKSIMHYGFDYHWLRRDSRHNLHSLRHVLDDKELSDREKEFLKGIHDRHGGLAKEPSKLDLEALKKVYHGELDAIEQLKCC